MKKALIIDDEHLARSIVKEYLKNFNNIEIVGECNNGFEGVKAIEEHQPDLIFLDIQMPKINGFEMLELIDESPSVIFTTAFDEYAIRAFEESAIDYLLKPYTLERFTKAMEKWSARKNTSNLSDINALNNKQPDEGERIAIKDQGNIQIIPSNKVYHIEAYDDYVKIHTQEKSFLKKKTMQYYENTLSPKDFIRIHRSFIINVNYLTKIEAFEKNSYRATLTNGAVLPISRSAYADVKQILGL